MLDIVDIFVAGLNNADQRITEDVEKFAFAISELYSYTFKVSKHTILTDTLAQPALSAKAAHSGTPDPAALS